MQDRKRTEPTISGPASGALGPDEYTYARQAIDFGLDRSLRSLCRAYIDGGAAHLPPPSRWGHVALSSLYVRLWGTAGLFRQSRHMASLAVLFAGVVGFQLHRKWWDGVFAMAVSASSPLLVGLRRRALQDPSVAAWTLGAVAGLGELARGGSPLWATLALVMLLATKEAAILFWPFFATALFAMRGRLELVDVLPFTVPIAVWPLGFYVLGGRKSVAVAKIFLRSNDHPYSRAFQRGAPHRLLVDLLLLSPVTTTLAFATASGWPRELELIALVATCALMPLKNVRVVLAFDLLARAFVGTWAMHFAPWLGALVILSGSFVDGWIYRRVFVKSAVYDPVTANLVTALGMVNRPEPVDPIELARQRIRARARRAILPR